MGHMGHGSRAQWVTWVMGHSEWPIPCSASDNQLWITLNRNDIPQLAIYQIVAFFVENKNAVKLVIYSCGTLVQYPFQARWYQMASLLSAGNVNVAQLLTCTFIYRSLSTRKTGQRIFNAPIQLTFQCGVLCNRSCIVRSSETLIVWSVFCSSASIRLVRTQYTQR